MSRQLPPQPNLEFLRNEAKDLRRAHRDGDERILQLIRDLHPKVDGRPPLEQIAAMDFSIQDAQLVLARQYHFSSWPDMVARLHLVEPRQQMAQALRDEDLPAIERLLNEQPELIDTDVESGNHGPPLSWAANRGKLKAVEFLLPRSAAHVKHAFGRAVLLGHLDVARLLLAHDPSAAGEIEFALFGPCESLRAAPIPFLIELGANPNAVWENGGTPLDMAICTYMKTGREGTIEALVQGGVNFEEGPEMDIHRGQVEALAARLDADPDLVHRPSTFRDGKEYGGVYGGAPLIRPTLLHICAEFGAVDCARLLLDRGADVNARCVRDSDDIGDQTPLFHAANQKHDEMFPMLDLLLERGADVNARASIRVPRGGLQSVQPDDPVLHGVTPLGYLTAYPNSLHHRARDEAFQRLRDHGAVE